MELKDETMKQDKLLSNEKGSWDEMTQISALTNWHKPFRFLTFG